MYDKQRGGFALLALWAVILALLLLSSGCGVPNPVLRTPATALESSPTTPPSSTYIPTNTPTPTTPSVTPTTPALTPTTPTNTPTDTPTPTVPSLTPETTEPPPETTGPPTELPTGLLTETIELSPETTEPPTETTEPPPLPPPTPELISPREDRCVETRPELSWRGTSGQAYQVDVWHVDSKSRLTVITTVTSCIPGLPAKKEGEWRWTVSRGSRASITDEGWWHSYFTDEDEMWWHFWYAPCGECDATSTPTPTETTPPPP